ncbi:hypothetical protein EMIT0P74_110132 [Pseudomonas sp. IT-P74]
MANDTGCRQDLKGSLPQILWPAAGLAFTEDQTVGASLLAMAECQATSVLNVAASSRAGSLPQVLCFN